MTDGQLRRVLACTGLGIGLLTFLTVVLYFMYAGPPPPENVLTRSLLGLVSLALVIVFVAALAELLKQAKPACALPTSVMYGSGLIFVAVALVAAALETGVVYGAPGQRVDPTTDGILADAIVLLHGSVKRLLSALFLAAAALAVRRTRALPAWTAWLAWAFALVNLAFVPSLYFGTDVTRFYSAIGWGNSALAGCLIGVWMFAVGIACLGPARAGLVRPAE